MTCSNATRASVPRPQATCTENFWRSADVRRYAYSRHRDQARRQEMKWGQGVFCKKSGKWGRCFFVKSCPFLNAGCIMYSISIFILHFTYLGVRTHPTHPLPTGLQTDNSTTTTLSFPGGTGTSIHCESKNQTPNSCP